MNKRFIIVFILLCFGCASWQAVYQPMGKYDNSEKTMKTIVTSPDDVQIWVNEIPDGFSARDGVLYVDTSLGNKILGSVSISVKRPNLASAIILGVLTLSIATIFMSTPPDLTREDVVRLLKEKCHAIGGNAIISATIPRPDFKGYGVFGGIAVIKKGTTPAPAISPGI